MPPSDIPPDRIGTAGPRYWHRNGELHRDDGPAVERPDGMRLWYRDGFLHREDGPAIEWRDGTGSWWINGQRLTPEQVAALTKR